MTKFRTVEPPWEFLLSASRNSLQSFELNRLSHAANLRKEIVASLDQWLAENTMAMLARLLMDQRASGRNPETAFPAANLKPQGVQTASDNLLADTAFMPPADRGNF